MFYESEARGINKKYLGNSFAILNECCMKIAQYSDGPHTPLRLPDKLLRKRNNENITNMDGSGVCDTASLISPSSFHCCSQMCLLLIPSFLQFDSSLCAGAFHADNCMLFPLPTVKALYSQTLLAMSRTSLKHTNVLSRSSC